METGRQRAWGDAAAVSMILLTALIVSWPILRGGYVTYADNAAHLAEIHSLASEKGGGWSDIAFCGFPIGTLHSPLWYGALAALVRVGLPAGALYALALFIGFIAPSLALYHVGRRYLTPLSAALIAYVFLIQRPALVGLGSPLAGMWTYFLAVALFILLADRVSRGFERRRDLVALSGLIGLIAITHLFPLVPLAILAGVHLARAAAKRSSPAALGLQAAAAVLGAIAAAAYWLPMALASGATTFTPQNLAPGMALARFVFPTDVVTLVTGEGPAFTWGALVAAIPMWTLIAAGISGLFMWKRWKCEVALYAAATAVMAAVLVIVVAPATNARVFGPVSWRLLDFARAGFALGAIPLLMLVEARVLRIKGATSVRRAVSIALAFAGLASALWWGAPLRGETPHLESREMADVRGLWRWLDENREDDWGRVYLQDTFMTPPESAELSESHVLSLTARESGVRQLGPYYGVVPYQTRGWTMGQVGLLYGVRVRRAEDIDEIRRRMRLSNATHLVTADPLLGNRFAEAPGFRLLERIGRFSVFEAEGVASEWVAPLQNGAVVVTREYRTGFVAFAVDQNARGARTLVKSSYHPFWKLDAPTGARLVEGPSGLMQVLGLPPGEHEVTLDYREPRWPAWVSIAGWFLIGALALFPFKSPKRLP